MNTPARRQIPSPPPPLVGSCDDLPSACRELIASMGREPWGQLSPSIYETARLVTLTPWLTDHARRVTFLVNAQHHDGSWDARDGYALVPTLSATEALLTTLRRGEDGDSRGGADGRLRRDQLLAATNRALSSLFDRLGDDASLSIPDTPAVEIIVPALVAALNQHLDRLSVSPLAGLEAAGGSKRLRLPGALQEHTLAAIIAGIDAGAPLPTKLMHSLEVASERARGAPGVRPVPPGTVGASPAATAAWLGSHEPPGSDPAAGYLKEVVSRHAGAAPSVVPITMFERAWVLSTLVTAGLRPAVPPELLDSLEATLGETGTAGGPGLPPDADTTSVALLTLARLGRRRAVGCLWTFDTGSHFVTWHGERTPSTTTNAHVLDALVDEATTGADASRAAAACERVSGWLCEQQREEGAWIDKWHASTYYATACCALALHRAGSGASGAAVRRAVNWVLDTQRPDGSWGRWSGTVEETAYALQTLLLTTASEPARDRAAARGYAYLIAAAEQPERPPLWHDKDLYSPLAVVQAAVLAALHLAQRDPAVTALVARG